MISIGDRKRAGYMYGSESRGARRGRRAKCDCTGHVTVDGSVSAGICNMTMKGGDCAEEGGCYVLNFIFLLAYQYFLIT